MKDLLTKQEKGELFNTYLVYWVNSITDPDIQGLVKTALRAAPDYFWTKGYYHASAPPDEKHRSGMLRRIYKDCYYAKALIEAWGLVEWHDEIMAAVILHDCIKFGFDEQHVEKKRHGPETYMWLVRLWTDAGAGFLSDKAERVAQMLKRHDGTAWTKDPIATPLGSSMDPVDLGAWLVHTVDVIACKPLNYFAWGDSNA